jgi:hypothetical protein
MMWGVTQQLEQLAKAYFHQDWDLDSESPEAVIDLFIKLEERGAVAELAWELDRLLASPMSDTS